MLKILNYSNEQIKYVRYELRNLIEINRQNTQMDNYYYYTTFI